MISAQRWAHPHNGGQNFAGMPPGQQSFNNFQPQQHFNFQQQQQEQSMQSPFGQPMTGQPPRFIPNARQQSQFGQPVGPQMIQQMTGQPRFMPSGQQLPVPAVSGNGQQRMGNQSQPFPVPGNGQQRMRNQSQPFPMGQPPMNGQAFQPRQQMAQQQPQMRFPSSGPPRQPSMMQQPYNSSMTGNNNITSMQSPMRPQFTNNPMMSPQFNNNSPMQPSSSFRSPSMTMQQQQQQMRQQQMQQRGQIPQPAAAPPTNDMLNFTRARALSNTTEYTNTTGPNSPVKKSFSRYRATKLASVSVTFFDATYPPEATIGVSLDEAKLAYTVNDSVNIRNIPVCAIAVNSQNDSIQAGDHYRTSPMIGPMYHRTLYLCIRYTLLIIPRIPNLN